MDGVWCHLGQVEVGRMLREESEAKTEFSVSLREARVEELAKDQQEKLEFDKLAKELHGMSEGICKLRELYEEVQSSLHQKELLCSGKNQAEYNEKILKLEGENKDLALSSDEAFARIQDLEKRTAANSEEICSLKRFISVIQMNSEMQKKASVDQKVSDEWLLELEEDSRMSGEQFLHVEEARREQQTLFQASYSEWEREKSSLLDEISSLRGSLDARIRDDERASIELQKKTSEIERMKSELEILRLNLIQNQQAHEQERASLLAALDDKDAQIVDLEQQISMLRSVILAKSETNDRLSQEKGSYFRLAEDRNCIIKDLMNEVDQLRNKLAEREADIFDAIRDENEKLISSIKEFESLDQSFESAVISLAEKDAMLNAALEEAEGPKIVEVAEENLAIANSEKETDTLCKVQEKSLLHFSEQAKEVEIQELRSQLEKETRLFENLHEELESHKHVLLEDRTNESIERESFIAQLENMCQQIGLLCSEDAELVPMMGKLSQFKDMPSSRKYVQVSLDERDPLVELNVNSIRTAKQMD